MFQKTIRVSIYINQDAQTGVARLPSKREDQLCFLSCKVSKLFYSKQNIWKASNEILSVHQISYLESYSNISRKDTLLASIFPTVLSSF